MRSRDEMVQRAPRSGRPGMCAPLAALLVAAVPCCGQSDEQISQDLSELQVYADDYYDAADVALVDGYWIDDWYRDGLYTRGASTRARAAMAVTAGEGRPITRPAAALRALAQGTNVCPGHVTVIPRTAMTCRLSGELGTLRSGATIDFHGCALDDGGVLDGTVDITASPYLEDMNCDENTVVDVTYTTTLTDLRFRSRRGDQLLIPSLANNGSYSRPATSGPTSLSIRTEGTIQRIHASGAVTTSHGVRGSGDYTFATGSGGVSYSVNGTLAISDRAGGEPVTTTGHGVTITSGCCHAVGGSVTVGNAMRTWAAWAFGPTCGAISLNGAPSSATACP